MNKVFQSILPEVLLFPVCVYMILRTARKVDVIHAQHTIFWFIVCFASFILSCWAGDDDVIYRFLNRRPTPQEGLARTRFVLIKILASFCGGALMMLYFSVYILRQMLAIRISNNEALLLLIPFVGIAGLLMGIIQNIIRGMQARQQRPLLDPLVFRYLRGQWVKFFHGPG